MRAMHRLRTACEEAHEPRCAFSDPAYFNFSRQIQKNLEHTWGVSVPHYGNDQNANWTNEEFHADLPTNSQLQYMVASWVEQRNYGVHFPLAALKAASHPLAAKIEAEFAAMEPRVPVPTAGMKKLPLSSPVVTGLGGWADAGWDSKTGALTHLAKTGGASIAGPANPLLLVRYQALVESDFDAWRSEYILPGAGGFNEYGKPSGFMKGADGQPITGGLFAPALTEAWVASDKSSLLLGLSFAPDLHADFGAPSTAWMRIGFATKGEVTASLTLVNKTATRLPEAAWVTNTPVGSGAGNWSMDKLGGAVSPLEVADGASRGLHNVLSGVTFMPKAGGSVFFGSSDAGVVRWDKPLPFPTPLHAQPDLSVGQSWMLWNNIWNTVSLCARLSEPACAHPRSSAHGRCLRPSELPGLAAVRRRGGEPALPLRNQVVIVGPCNGKHQLHPHSVHIAVQPLQLMQCCCCFAATVTHFYTHCILS